MATAAKTGTPRRQTSARTAPAKATTKPAATKAASVKTEAPAAETEAGLAKVGPIELIYDRETVKYAVFKAPEGTGCTGSFYAPLGTTQVRVMLYGPAEALTE